MERMSIDKIKEMLFDDEQIAHIKGSENYLVTSYGRVYSCMSNMGVTSGWRELKHRKTRAGYHRVQIFVEKTQKMEDKYVHRLVLETFGPIDNMDTLDCAHLDDNKDNNKLSNLRWMTRFENNHWGNKIERGASKRRIRIYQYDINGNFLREYDGLRSAERETGLCHQHISKCARNIYKQYGGYIWSFTKIKNGGGRNE